MNLAEIKEGLISLVEKMEALHDMIKAIDNVQLLMKEPKMDEKKSGVPEFLRNVTKAAQIAYLAEFYLTGNQGMKFMELAKLISTDVGLGTPRQVQVTLSHVLTKRNKRTFVRRADGHWTLR